MTSPSEFTSLAGQLEELRTHNGLGEVYERSKAAVELGLTQLSALPEEMVPGIVLNLRLLTDSLMSFSRQSWNGRQSGRYLREARDFMNHYDDPAIVRAAAAMSDHQTGIYMLGELRRDKGTYYRRAYDLTGNIGLAAHSAYYYRQAAEKTDKEQYPSTHYLSAAQYEQVYGPFAGNGLYYEAFRTAASGLILFELSQGKNYDRLGTVAGLLSVESAKRFDFDTFRHSWNVMNHAVEQGNFSRYRFLRNPLALPIFRMIQRATLLGTPDDSAGYLLTSERGSIG